MQSMLANIDPTAILARLVSSRRVTLGVAWAALVAFAIFFQVAEPRVLQTLTWAGASVGIAAVVGITVTDTVKLMRGQSPDETSPPPGDTS